MKTKFKIIFSIIVIVSVIVISSVTILSIRKKIDDKTVKIAFYELSKSRGKDILIEKIIE